MTDDIAFSGGTVHLAAPAKLTWFLEILGRRDDGYHALRSEMLSLSLQDELTIDETRDEPAEMVSDDGSTLLTGVATDDNLVTRALAFVDRRAAVTVRKRIPPGGGLGGGSADAGAILWWAGVEDVATAAVLGGDVPFCVRGGRALVEGMGERVTAMSFVDRTVTVFVPRFAVGTAACYQAFDELRDAGDVPEGRNHLTAAACLVQPDLAVVLAWTAAELSQPVTLCGSGSTFFVEGSVAGLAQARCLVTPVGELAVHTLVAVPARGVPA